MSESMKLPFFNVFSAYAPTDEALLTLLATCMVTDMRVDPASRTIIASLLPETPLDAELMNRLSVELAAAYGVTAAILQQGDKQPIPQTEKRPAGKKEKGRPGTAMYGQVRLKSVTPISELNLDMGTVLIEGDVFAVDHKDLRNRTDKVVRFDITDYTGSVRVTQFMTQQDSAPIIKHLKEGQHLLVQGRLTMDRFENDMVLQPTGILYGEKKARQDTAPDKRVELHLHTRMSAMDALTDTKAVVQQAAAWGHRAIAITDHGVAHSFPDAAGGAKGTAVKVLYGVEAYYMN
ncbi:MAG: PHP domain-containing protein, partial [Oscillospiraceae bacterium]